MRRKLNYILSILVLILGILGGCGNLQIQVTEQQNVTQREENQQEDIDQIQAEEAVTESGEYTSKEEVALYLHTFEHLPSNYITKKEAQKLGWVSKEGNLWK